MKPEKIMPAKGKLLISEPALYDFYFKQSVVLLAEHNEGGSFGLIINKPMNVKFSEVVKDFPYIDTPVYLGGPVKTDNLFILHKLGKKIDNSFEIIDGVYWGGDIFVIKQLLMTKKADVKDFRFFVGYSGWAPKQLDKEMKESSWIVSDAELSNVFEPEPANLWGKIMKGFGRHYAIWANFPQDPIMN
jgi:putative transcriptional regulator